MDNDHYDSIPAAIEAGTVEYWKARARQEERRNRRAQNEYGSLIAEHNALKARAATLAERVAQLEGMLSIAPKRTISQATRARREEMAAVRSGDVYSGRSSAPRGL